MGRDIHDLIITKNKDLKIEKGDTVVKVLDDIAIYSREARSWHLVEDELLSESELKESLIIIEDDNDSSNLHVIVKGKELQDTIDMFWVTEEDAIKSVRDFCENKNLSYYTLSSVDISNLIIKEFVNKDWNCGDIKEIKHYDNSDKSVYDTETGGLDLNKVTSQVHVTNMFKPINNYKWVNTIASLVRRELQESNEYVWFHLTDITKIMFKYNNGLVQEFDVSEDVYSEEARDYTVIVFNQEEKFIVVDSPDNIVLNYDNYDGLKFKIPSNSQIIVDKVDNKTLEVYINII